MEKWEHLNQIDKQFENYTAEEIARAIRVLNKTNEEYLKECIDYLIENNIDIISLNEQYQNIIKIFDSFSKLKEQVDKIQNEETINFQLSAKVFKASMKSNHYWISIVRQLLMKMSGEELMKRISDKNSYVYDDSIKALSKHKEWVRDIIEWLSTENNEIIIRNQYSVEIINLWGKILTKENKIRKKF